ncbi:hypothetical protein ACFLV7_06580 [Chloroflexota bacterium]
MFLKYFLAAIQTFFPDNGGKTLALLKAVTLPPLQKRHSPPPRTSGKGSAQGLLVGHCIQQGDKGFSL